MGLVQKMDSVFDFNSEEETDFDTIFDTEDSLIDTVNGVNEDGSSLLGGVGFDTLHQTEDDGVTPKDFEDELGPGNDDRYGAPNPEASDKWDDELLDYSIGKKGYEKSDADDFYEDSDDDYQEGKDNYGDPDPDDLEGTIDKAIGESEDIEDVLGDDSGSLPDPDVENFDEAMNFAYMSEAESVDSDIEDVVNSEYDTDNIDIEEAMSSDDDLDMDLSYDSSDEDAIDFAMNN